MRRGLTHTFSSSFFFWYGRRNEFPDEKGIDTTSATSCRRTTSPSRNEFPDEKGIDTYPEVIIIFPDLSRNEFPDEKGIDTILKSQKMRSIIPQGRNEFPDEKGIDTILF